MAGEVDLDQLTPDQGVVFNAEISAAIEEGLARTDYGAALAAGGITMVALNEDGEELLLPALTGLIEAL